MTKSQELGSIKLPRALLSRVENRTRHTEFDDSAAYVSYILEEVLHEVEEDADFGAAEDVDKNQVEDRLKSLGYLND